MILISIRGLNTTDLAAAEKQVRERLKATAEGLNGITRIETLESHISDSKGQEQPHVMVMATNTAYFSRLLPLLRQSSVLTTERPIPVKLICLKIDEAGEL